MVSSDTPAIAIIAKDVCSIATIFFRHRLLFNMPVEPAKLTLHVCDALGADRALVAGIAPLGEAGLMDAVPTSHEGHRPVRGKHIFAADGAVALGALLDTLVRAFSLDRHAGSTRLAVEEVLAQSFTKSTNATVVAVIDLLAQVVVPQLADGTVVVSCKLVAHSTDLSSLLRSVAKHTQHVLGLSARESMVLHLIVANTTSIPSAASIALHFDISLVVDAAKFRLRWLRHFTVLNLFGVYWRISGRPVSGIKIEDNFLAHRGHY
jgi:hypothetical protein